MTDLASIMTLDFTDDGLGADEFKKAKEKKFVDLTNFQLDENLSDLERSLKLVVTGVPVQISCAFRSLSRLAICAVVVPMKRSFSQQQETAAENWNLRLSELFDVVVSTIADKSTAATIVVNAVNAISAFCYHIDTHPPALLETDGDAIGMVSTQLLRVLLAVLNRGSEQSKQVEVFQLALQTLPSLMLSVPVEAYISIGIPMAAVMADVSRPDESRIVACKLLGSVSGAGKLKESQCEELMIPAVVRLCQDTSAEVREAMSHQLNNVIRSLSKPSLVDQMMTEVLELLEDEKVHVRSSVLSATILMLDFLPIDFVRQILPRMKTYCDVERSGIDKMAPNIPEQFGMMFHYIFSRTNIFEDASSRTEHMDHFLKCYKTMAASTNDETRRWCAYNYPAILKNVGSESFDDHFLRNGLMRFARDTCVPVRALVANFFHEICALLTPNQCVSCLHDVLITLLQDSDVTVRYHIVQNLDLVLRSFQIEDQESRKAQYQDLLPAIVACSKDGSNNDWRAHCTLVEHFHDFPKYFNHASLARLLVPQLLKIMEGSGSTMQRAACRALVIFGRDCPETRIHEEMMRRFDNQYCCAESFTKRKIYLIACEEMLQTHSLRFGRERLMLTIVTLFDDLVLDVKRKALLLIPLLWNSLQAKEYNNIRKLLLERLDIEAGLTNSVLISQTAAMIKTTVLNLLQSDTGGDMATKRDCAQKNVQLEEQENSLRVYKNTDSSSSKEQIFDRLMASNKASRIAQKKNLTSVSSDEDEEAAAAAVVSVRQAKTTVGSTKARKNSNTGTAGSGNKLGRKVKKPAALPIHNALPAIMGADSSRTTSEEKKATTKGTSRNLNKIKRRGPPGKGKSGLRSPRAGKGIKNT